MRYLSSTISLYFFSACGFEAAFDRATAHHDEFASGTSGSSAGLPDLVTDAGGDDVQTVTSAGDDEEPSTSDPATGEPATGGAVELPQVLSWEASATDVWALGPVDLTATVSRDVVAVDVLRDGELVATLVPPALTYEWAVIGEAQDGVHTWEAVAHSEDASSEPASLQVTVDVPAGGLPLWATSVDDPALSLAVGVAHVDQGAAVVAGWLQDKTGGTLALRRFDGETLTWTRTAKAWSALPSMQGHTTATDVAVDGEGNIIVVGNVVGQLRRYVAKLDPATKVLWEITGNINERANGVAVDDEGRVYIAGAGPVAGGEDTRLMVWSVDAAGVDPWLAAYEDTADMQHLRSERANAVVRIGDRIVVVGEAQVKGGDNFVVTRTIVLQVTPGGEVKEADTWLSPGDWGEMDGATDVIALGDEYCLTGWSGSPPRPLTRCSAGLQPWWSTLHAPGRSARSISHTPRLEVVVAGETAANQVGRGWVEALVPGGDEVAWSFTGGVADEHLYGVACGTWGPCVVVGQSTQHWFTAALTP